MGAGIGLSRNRRSNRWESPKYLIGESYGTTRVSGLALELQEPLSVSDYRVHMSSVLDSDLQSSVPLVQLDVKLDRSVEQSRGQKD